MTGLFSIFFLVLLLLVCGLGVVRMTDPVESSRRARIVMRVLLLLFAVVTGVMVLTA